MHILFSNFLLYITEDLYINRIYIFLSFQRNVEAIYSIVEHRCISEINHHPHINNKVVISKLSYDKCLCTSHLIAKFQWLAKLLNDIKNRLIMK